MFAEEFGFVGSLFLLCLFLFFLYKGFSISIRAPDDFGRLLGAGIVIMIVTQSLINVAAMTGIFPLTGIPLVFVSKGGSSLIMTLVEAGILLNISKQRKSIVYENIIYGRRNGGHFYPLMAVADTLNAVADQEKIANLELIYMAEHPYDRNILLQNGIKFKKFIREK